MAVNLVAFIALVEFLNQTLIWLGNRAGMEKPGDELTFQVKSCECGPYLSFSLIFIDQVWPFVLWYLVRFKILVLIFF